jgi:hypothetical protein
MRIKRIVYAIFLWCSFYTATAQVPSNVPTNGLVGYWPFNGNANDVSGNNLNGTVTGASLTTDRNGNSNSAYSFDGVNDFISVPANIIFTQNPISYSFWFNKSGSGNPCNGNETFQAIFSTGNYSQSRDVVLSQGNDRRIGIQRSIPSGCPNESMLSTNYTLNNWNYAVVIYEANLVKVYLNGIFIGSSPVSCSVTATNTTCFIGASKPSIWACIAYFNGLIDDIAIYNRALTPQEITNLYTPCTNPPAAPVASTNQTFCVSPAPTVASLSATGTGIQWYATSLGGTALTSTTTLVNGTTYYASQTVNGCESGRTAVTVTVTPQTSPTFIQVGAVCSGTTLPPLPTTSTNGITGTWSPALNNITTTYTFTPTAGQCASTTAMTITVETTAAPTGLANQIYAGTTTTLANLSVTGTNLKWYNNATSGTLLSNSTIVNDGTTYYASQTVLGCESTARLAVIAYKISDTSQTFCNGALVNSLISTPTSGYTTNWFATNTGGVALTGSETLTTGTYYVEQRTTVNMVSTFAGSGASGDTDGIGTAASFKYLHGIAVDGLGNVYVADYGNNKVRKITSLGYVTTVAGSGIQGDTDGVGHAASFNGPTGVAVDASGNIYVADYGNNKIRQISISGYVTTIAGSGIQGDTDDVGVAASFNGPSGVSVDASGNILVSDYRNNKIRKITPTGTVSTFAGSGIIGDIDGIGINASFQEPFGLCVDGLSNLYIADTSNMKIRKITSNGFVSTLAGNGVFGSTDGISTSASFALPNGVAVDGLGNIYVSDHSSHKIRKITSAGEVSTFAGPNFYFIQGDVDGIGSEARFRNPHGVAVDMSGNVYVTDWGNNKIRKISTSYYISNRVAVNVIVNNNLVPTASAQTFCASATVANLTATGTAIKWYASASGGTALATTTILTTGTYYASQTINGCESGRTVVAVTVTPQTTPTFTQFAPGCSGAPIAPLPTTSNNGITGTWSPALNNTATTTYTFTPSDGQCAASKTMTITVNPNIIPAFTQVAPICSGATLNALPTTSTNGITGMWSPELDNTATTTYTFTPTVGQCANTTTMTIVVNDSYYTFYVDADGDGIGAGTEVYGCLDEYGNLPPGYSWENWDCNDNDANSISYANYFYVDADGDGIGGEVGMVFCSDQYENPPPGYSWENWDCNDNDANVFQPSNWIGNVYIDADGDGFGSGNPTSTCMGWEYNLPQGYSWNNSDCDDHFFSSNGLCLLTLNVKLYLQGYYKSNQNQMTPLRKNAGVSPSQDEVDQVTVSLYSKYDVINPIIATATAVVGTNGTVGLQFVVLPDEYFILVEHKNAIKTWSATPVAITNGTTYDFTTAASQAYGNNQIEVAPGIYALYSGDMNQDGTINEADLPIFTTANTTAAHGYLVSDLNGDGSVDLLDYPIYKNNAAASVNAVRPRPVPAGTVHCNPNNPTAIVDVTNPTTGKTWMDRNLGASQSATSSTDANAYGDLYQWGRRSDGHQCRTSPTTSTLSSTDQPAHGSFILAPSEPVDWRSPKNTNLWQGVSGTNNPCPSGYRLPTETELNAERTSWSINNAAGAFASPLKLPMAGYRFYSNGSLYFVGTYGYGYYWSSTVFSTNSRFLTFGSRFAGMSTDNRALGCSVRCLKD